MTGLPGVSGAVEGQALVLGLVRAQHDQVTTILPKRPTDDDAKDHADPMSRSELPEPNFTGSPPVTSSPREAPSYHDPSAGLFEEQQIYTPMLRSASRPTTGSLRHERDGYTDQLGPLPGAPNRELPFAHMRVHFEDFARQLRLHRHHEHKRRMLHHQRDRLRNAVALSARLQRVGSWVHDGLVQISQQSDAAGFTRVHQHMQDLVSLCQSQWQTDIHALDATPLPKPETSESFFAKLSPSSRDDCLELLDTLRHNPHFLVEKFKAMNLDQIKGLSTSPKFRNLSESVLTSLSENRGRDSLRRRPRSFLRDSEDGQQLMRSKAYSKELEDYASSFERSNPLSFLIHNVYAPSKDIENHESQLRFSTWSTICASLFIESRPAFDAIIGDVLSAFAHLFEWQIKERFEMFLMGSLQRGAFLYDSVEPASAPSTVASSILDSMSTPQAKEFFDREVGELFQILGSGDEGVPKGALRLGRAIVGKLPTLGSQSEFRGHLFNWFLHDFLRIAMSFPEDESMLLKFHINGRARSHLLQKLWECAYARANDSISQMRTQPIDQDVQNSVNYMLFQIDADQCINPYQYAKSSLAPLEASDLAYISVCAADIAHLLEKLKPQVLHSSNPFDSFLSSSQATFNQQYSRATSKFDRLCRRMLDSIEPGHSSRNVHPGQENWALLLISSQGHLSLASQCSKDEDSTAMEGLGDFDPAEHAAIRLASGPRFLHSLNIAGRTVIDRENRTVLSEMFAEQRRTSHIKTDSLASMYWHTALTYLSTHYPLTVLTGDDTKVLEPILQKLHERRLQITNECFHLEQEVAGLEGIYASAQADLTTASGSLNKLRIKLWYAIYVTSSEAYENARNITVALNNMAIPTLLELLPTQEIGAAAGRSRPGTSATSASTGFDQPRIDTETIMKAPAEHGGPRKLSDAQIEKTRKWLERYHVENFCQGEERIHRFCMEVKSLTRKLVGDTIGENPVLWSNELFAREKTLYEIDPSQHGSLAFSGLSSSRAPSVMSEPLSSTFYPVRSSFGGSRASIFGGSNRIGRDFPSSDIASFISSPGRATTTISTTGSSLWSSPALSNSRSVTSASLPSRTPSTFGSSGLNHTVDRSQERTDFLDSLRQDLTSLLLSDLACPVWSCGSESDAWIDTICRTPSILARLRQRSAFTHLPPSLGPAVSTPAATSNGPQRRRERSRSAAPRRVSSGMQDRNTQLECVEGALFTGDSSQGPDKFPYFLTFTDILCRIRDHTDPILKLRAVRDFKMLSQDFQRSQQKDSSSTTVADGEVADNGLRRKSLNPSLLSGNLRRRQEQKTPDPPISAGSSEEDIIVQSLKNLLLVLRPKTLFRDLQYVAVFVSSENLHNADLGQAFTHVGLAALAWKDEVCRAMVDVADRIVARDSIKRNVSSVKTKEPSVLKAMEYWIIGAREGNAIAQRELASLYLTHPDVPPIVSLPLTLSSDIFKREMMWESDVEIRSDSPALCLALYWMQEASKKKDAVAQSKLREREAERSVR